MRTRTKTITTACPICQHPDATCEHGIKDGLSESILHFWNCPECGENWVRVLYECPECQEVFEANALGKNEFAEHLEHSWPA